MTRTKLFLSYSHRDRSWLERLKVHLALLQRRGLVHVWSDTRIGVGDRWQQEIESALTESRAAVLLISPDFLASAFIWGEEMPRLIAHQKKGMAILPLIVRPCAWRIAPELAELQARPGDGALALGADAEIDLALAEFVYELAGRLEQLPATVASEERDLLRARRSAASEIREIARPNAGTDPLREAGGSVLPIEQGQTWAGMYYPTQRRLRLTVRERTGRRFRGEIEYMDDDSATDVAGEWGSIQEGLAHQALREVEKGLRGADCAISFRETRVVKKGRQPPELGGEYIGLVSGSVMKGVWQSRGSVLGDFELRLEE